MIHVAIDTSGTEKNRSTDDANYKALKRLVDANEITIHVPYIVEREIETQEKEFYLERSRALLSSLKKFNNIKKSHGLHATFNQIYQQVFSLKETINADAISFSQSWLQGLNCNIHPLTNQQSTLAWEAYFNGTFPLTSPKNRMDIPDSFICRSIEDILNQVTILTLIAKDNKIVNTFKSKQNIKIYSTLRDFLESSEIQVILEKLDTSLGLQILHSKVSNLLGFIINYENSTNLIHDFLESDVGGSLLYKTISGIPFSNEGNGEATISSYYNGRAVNLNLEKPIHYGENQIGFPFELEIEVNIDYFIDKHEYYSEYYNDDSPISDISVEDWNDHVVHAEDEVDLKVAGIVSITIDPTEIDPIEIAECDASKLDDYFNDLYCMGSVKIESIDSIELN
jgi:hypothetical protein